MKQINWVIQKNLLSEISISQMKQAFENNGIEYQEVDVIPFSDLDLDLNISKYNILYGGVSFVNQIQKKYGQSVGVFYDSEKFSIENYINQWKEHMLNSDAIITSFDEFICQKYDDESLWFIRPNSDDKPFEGQVKSFEEIKNWQSSLQHCDNIELNGQTKIIASKPWAIAKEWRLYVVDGQIVASSRYREYLRLSKSSTDIPQEMLDFANNRIKEYCPNGIFCMDIAFCGDSYYIIECGCINSCGFYAASIENIIVAITNYCKLNQQ